MEQPIWYNSNIRISGLPLYDSVLSQNGLNKIKDLLEDNLSLIDWETFSSKFNTRDYLKYWGIKKAIPAFWLDCLNKPGMQTYRILYNESADTAKMVNVIYRHRKNDPILMGRIVYKWSKYLEQEIDEEMVIKCLCNINKIAIVTKLRSFQYRVLLHGIITNHHLKWYKIRENENCTFL